MMRVSVQRFLRDHRGATAVEYGMLTALIAVTILAALDLLGSANSGALDKSADAIAAAGT